MLTGIPIICLGGKMKGESNEVDGTNSLDSRRHKINKSNFLDEEIAATALFESRHYVFSCLDE